METKLNVEGMSCEHCVKSITDTITALPGTDCVVVDLKEKIVTVSHSEELTVEKIKSEIEDIGYDVN